MIKNFIKSAVATALCGFFVASTAQSVLAADAATSAAAPAPVPFTFNRLLKKQPVKNPPPAEDGIHDPTVDSIDTLQPPKIGMSSLVPSTFGNMVDWVQTIETQKIKPRWERLDPNAEGLVMDVNIERVPRGSMPIVVFPHKQHTEWLECSNCHPAIFVPQKGANQISMAAILLGQKCGVCHGKVSFPVYECKKCHSKKKTTGTAFPGATVP